VVETKPCARASGDAAVNSVIASSMERIVGLPLGSHLNDRWQPAFQSGRSGVTGCAMAELSRFYGAQTVAADEVLGRL
jgi:hypothetical protein